MSEIRVEKVFCPKCGKEGEVTLMASLNAQLDPNAAKQLMDGSLFLYTCDGCGEVSKLDYELVYHDMEHLVMVHYVREESVEQTKEVLDNLGSLLTVDMTGYRYRIVTSQAALREKAIIFSLGLDDRIIECIKLMCFAQASEQFPDAQISAVYFYEESGKYYLDFVGNRPLSMELPESMYENIHTNFRESFDDSGEKEYVVDLMWAVRFLNPGE